MRRVTFSRNYTLSLSRSCQCHCKYCAFATHQPHLLEPAEVEAALEIAVRRRAKELLVLTGELPEHLPAVAARLRALGHEDFVSYVVWVCERALERGLLPHTNIGVIGRADLGRLRAVTASQGLMLESVSERLMSTVHAGSPTKHPAMRLQMIELAGELRIPFTTGLLIGIGETEEERLAGLEAIARASERHGHVQEVIIQNFVPHPRYHGQDVAAIADRAARDRWSALTTTGVMPPSDPDAREHDSGAGAAGYQAPLLPEWATPVTLDDLRRLVGEARRLMPEVGIQVPPNLAPWWSELITAGASDLGGLSANGDHVSPEHPFPSPREARLKLAGDGFALTERLCVYRGFIAPEWLAPAVVGTILRRYPTFAPTGARTPASGASRDVSDLHLVRDAVERAREGERLMAPELTALFLERRPEMVELIRVAADRLRSDLAGDDVTYVVNRNINFTNICTVGCAFCGFGETRRSAAAYEIDDDAFRRKVAEAVECGATEICMQGGIHPAYTLDDYGHWLTLAKREAPNIHLHAYSPMEIDHMCQVSGLSPAAVFEFLIERGLGSTPGTAAEVLDDGVRDRISPNKLPAARWVEIIEAAHAAGLRSTSTVMFGHIETAAELAAHMAVIRDLQERTGGITEFVPLSFIPYNTLLGRTHGIEELSLAENLRHTAVFRLALGRSIANVQASWVKMGLDAATESLRWGVNDLGGTLMEESISRSAGSRHGSRLEPEDLIGAAHAAGRPAAQRDTLYRVLASHPLEMTRSAA